MARGPTLGVGLLSGVSDCGRTAAKIAFRSANKRTQNTEVIRARGTIRFRALPGRCDGCRRRLHAGGSDRHAPEKGGEHETELASVDDGQPFAAARRRCLRIL
jgi:hypothetical protein